MTIDPDLLHPASRQDPHAAYAALREGDPVHWHPRLGMWVVTRYDDVEAVVADTARFSVDRFGPLGQGRGAPAVAAMLRRWAVYRDPPEHTRLRALLAQSFTPRRVGALRARIEAVVDALLDAAAPGAEIDFVAAVAFPLPATVIATMLGVPLEDLPRIKRWSNQIADFIGGACSGADADHAQQGLLDAMDYFRGVVHRRRHAPDDDVLTLLLGAEERGDTLDEDEVVANCVLLLFAGHETTTNLLANGLHHLLRHPTALALLRAHAELIPSAVEEFLRYDAPVAGTLRIARTAVVLGGRTIAAGDVVAAMLASANRDPRRFAQPDALDVTRTPNRHLAFGYGAHFCLGAGLARLEAQVAFTTLLRRFARVVPCGPPPSWKPQVFFRELERLPVALEA